MPVMFFDFFAYVNFDYHSDGLSRAFIRCIIVVCGFASYLFALLVGGNCILGSRKCVFG